MQRSDHVNGRFYCFGEWYGKDIKYYFPADFGHYLYIIRVDNVIIEHPNQYHLYNEAKTIKVKPACVDSLQAEQIIMAAKSKNTGKYYEWDKAPSCDIRIICRIPSKYYDAIDKNTPVKWNIDPHSLYSLKLCFMGTARNNKYLKNTLIEELSTHGVSKRMLVCIIFILFSSFSLFFPFYYDFLHICVYFHDIFCNFGFHFIFWCFHHILVVFVCFFFCFCFCFYFFCLSFLLFVFFFIGV